MMMVEFNEVMSGERCLFQAESGKRRTYEEGATLRLVSREAYNECDVMTLSHSK